MTKKLLGLTAWGFMLGVFLLAATSARAQNVDERIQALEQELSQLKEQQIELKKEAMAAAAALPTFRYRPGDGLEIEAADKSWSHRVSMESHIRMNFLSGRDEIGRTNGEILGRRFRIENYFCLNNCLYEIELEIDMDGMGGGNAKNATGTGVGSILGRGVVHFHLENLNPWMPTLTAGMDISTSGAATRSRQGSSATGSQREYDLLSRNYPNTGSSGNGMTLTWDRRSLSGIGIPGRISRFQVGMANVSEGGDGLSNFSDRKDFTAYLGVEPFRSLKNKWIRGLLFEVGAVFCNIDGRPVRGGSGSGNTDNGCDRIRLRDHGDQARQTLFSTGSDSIGKGLFLSISPGITWTVGPYRLRGMGIFHSAEDTGGLRGKKRAHNFLIGHDLYIWSPKGFLTGSSNTPGSILLGYHFERNDASCVLKGVVGGCSGGGGSSTLNDFNRITVRLNEWDIWYVLAPRMSIGANVLWYDASNLTASAAKNLGVRDNTTDPGKGGDWVDISVTWRYQW